MENLKIRPTEFSDEVYKIVYGDDANVKELRKQKNSGEVWNDIVYYLAKDDVTKIDEIRNLPLLRVLDFLNSKAKTIKANNTPIKKPTIEPIGFKTNNENKEV
jgi:hypothetical protein